MKPYAEGEWSQWRPIVESDKESGRFLGGRSFDSPNSSTVGFDVFARIPGGKQTHLNALQKRRIACLMFGARELTLATGV